MVDGYFGHLLLRKMDKMHRHFWYFEVNPAARAVIREERLCSCTLLVNERTETERNVQTARAVRALLSPFDFDSVQWEDGVVWERPVCPTPLWDRCHTGHYPWATAPELFPVKLNQVNADSSSPTGTFLLPLVHAFRGCCSIPAWTREARAQRAGMTKALISATGFPRAVWLRWGEMRHL